MNAYIDQINTIKNNSNKSSAWIAYAQVWLSQSNRSVRLSYFSGSDATLNPSGSTSNVEYIGYYTKDVEQMRVYFSWDSNDNLTEQRNYPFS